MRRNGKSAPGTRVNPRLPGALAYLALVLVATAAGCASSRPGATPSEGVGSGAETDPKGKELQEEVRQSLESRVQGITSLRGRGYLWISSPDWQGAGQVNTIILSRRPDELRMRGLLPFSTVFDVVSSADRFFLYFPGEGEVWAGPPEELAPLTGLPILPRDVITGIFAAPIVEAEGLTVTGSDPGRVWVEWILSGDTRVRGEFSRSPVLPREFSVLEGDRLRVRLQYDDYLLEPGGWWPRDITLRWPELETRMRIRFVEIELNPEFKPGSFVFDPPEGVEWFEVESEERANAGSQKGDSQ
jgi:hypothetical protein